ncbi:MAG: ABC transporter ATP-binding protein, partial [Lachnospiraceae bacterium]|nr:ABC transporter ATP-binding protein [Lachnospiraceae bacterium]
MGKVCLEAVDLCKTYIVDGYSNNVLQNINLKIEEGEFVSIMGPSGSGKSTLLYTISGMDNMTAGTVVFDGEDISKLNDKQLTRLRLLKMGFIFQQMYMMKKLCIMDNIVLPGYQAKLRSRDEVNNDATSLMRRLGIIEIANREITEVSGGQLQRACMARALINNPKVLFADEPTGALNSKASTEVLNELVKANEAGTTILMVTHSEKVAASSDRIIYLMDGDIQGELKLGK